MTGIYDPLDDLFPEDGDDEMPRPVEPDPGRGTGAGAGIRDGSRMPTFLGDAYEVSTKLGIACRLFDDGLIGRDDPILAPFTVLTNEGIRRHIQKQLSLVDEGYIDQLRTEIEQIRLIGFFIGYASMRDFLIRMGEGVACRALWSPVEMRDRTLDDFEKRQEEAAASFAKIFGLQPGTVRKPAQRGDPVQADFMAMFDSPGAGPHLLVFEFSLNAPPEIRDFRHAEAHLAELALFAKTVERRSVFANISAEVTHEHFQINDGTVSNLSAFAGSDKPLYKLAQGCSYACRMVKVLRDQGTLPDRLRLSVMALTSRGVEALHADIIGSDSLDKQADPRFALMDRLGKAYRTSPKTTGDEDFARQAASILDHLLRGLPGHLRAQVMPLLDATLIGGATHTVIHEEVTGFVNPATAYPRDHALAWIPDDPEVASFLGANRVRDALERHLPPGPELDLRAVHGAAIQAALEAARPGEMRVIAAEGNPGIGKTHGARQSLADHGDGFLFIYISPRVLINTDVTADICKDMAGKVLAITTNHTINSGAPGYYQEKLVPQGADPDRQVDGGVIVDGLGAAFNDPMTSVLPVARTDADDIHDDHGDRGIRGRVVSSREKELYDRPGPGVLGTLAGFGRAAIAANPSVNRLVLTAAIQSYKDLGDGRNTITRLDKLFREKAGTPAGIRERRDFSKRFPTIIAMVDEITGDGAGVPIVHALAAWLRAQFMIPFQGKSPFRVSLVVADASLGNNVVFDRYLAIGASSPEKVMVSRGRPGVPFALATSTARFGDPTGGPKLPVLHVMADSYPAGRLEIEYVVGCEPVVVDARHESEVPKSARIAIREKVGEDIKRKAVREVIQRLSDIRGEGDTRGQVIFFAQDKGLLRDIQEELVKPNALTSLDLNRGNVAILDSSIQIRRRRHILENKNDFSVLLMTSSGARGISFPLARTIVTLVPRFSLESGLMEIGQLVYRGRGSVDGKSMDHLDRKLVFLLNDYVLRDQDEHPDDLDVKRRWVRQASDLVTFLLLLRGALFTRMTGDAGLPGQSLAIIPVGHVGADGVESTLSEAVATFLSESQTALRDGGLDAVERAMLSKASSDLERQCGEVSIRGTLGLRQAGGRRLPERESVISKWMEETRDFLTSPNLLMSEAIGRVSLPNRTSVSGRLLVERWDGIDIREIVKSDLLGNSRAESRRALLGNLRRIEDNPIYAKPIRAAAFKLLEILSPPHTTTPIDAFEAGKEIDDSHFWVAVPIDYLALDPHRRLHTGMTERSSLTAQDDWLDIMERAAFSYSRPTLSLPVLAAFERFPFLAFVSRGDVTGLERTFSDRHFMASHELNMLNTLFFKK